MSTPRLPTYIRNQIERRERNMQTAFPAKVTSWESSANTVQLEPQFQEAWVSRDGTRATEPGDTPHIDNVPVLFPRSGAWSITFPIETGSFGLVICTKYSLDVWRNQGQARDPGDLRRFGMSGAVFHPVNLHPNGSTLVPHDSDFMVLGNPSSPTDMDFVALKADVAAIKDELDGIVNSFAGIACSTGTITVTPTYTNGYTVAASSSVKVSK